MYYAITVLSICLRLSYLVDCTGTDRHANEAFITAVTALYINISDSVVASNGV